MSTSDCLQVCTSMIGERLNKVGRRKRFSFLAALRLRAHGHPLRYTFVDKVGRGEHWISALHLANGSRLSRMEPEKRKGV